MRLTTGQHIGAVVHELMRLRREAGEIIAAEVEDVVKKAILRVQPRYQMLFLEGVIAFACDEEKDLKCLVIQVVERYWAEAKLRGDALVKARFPDYSARFPDHSTVGGPLTLASHLRGTILKSGLAACYAWAEARGILDQISRPRRVYRLLHIMY